MRSKGAFVALLLAASATLVAQYRIALPGYRYEFPRDHFDHPEYQTEWWYYTGNLRAADGHRFGFELTFFRQAVNRDRRPGESPWTVHDVYLAHLALSDIDGRTFLHEERVNRAGPGLAGVDAPSGVIWNGNWRVQLRDGGAGGRLAQSLDAVGDRFALHLALDASKAPVINGVNGVSQKAAGAGQASHYVSLTRLLASGRVEVGGRSLEVQGSAWMDHEFFTNQLGRNQRGWDWLSVQLQDGTELMVYRLRRSDGSVDPFSSGTFVERDGRSTHLTANDFSMVPTGETWTSPESHAVYPIGWRVSLPSRGIQLEVRTALPSQELTSGTGWTPTYWEGAVTANGSQKGRPLEGVGYLELTGYDRPVLRSGHFSRLTDLYDVFVRGEKCPDLRSCEDPHMPFPVGAEVVVATLGKKGRVVEAKGGARYRVVVGPMTVWCVEADLAAVSEPKRSGKSGKRGAARDDGTSGGWSMNGDRDVAAGEHQREALASLDLHGMTVEEALRAVQERLDLAIRAGLDRVEIIHGISGGRLRAAVRGYLAGISSISRFEPDTRNPGVTWVFL